MLISLLRWIREQWLLIVGTVAVLVPLILWTARPISSTFFRVYAQDCGSILFYEGPSSQQGNKALQAEQCFLQAYQQCHAALLTYTEIGLDTGVKHTLTTANHFGICSLSDDTESYGNIRSTTTRYTCQSLIQRSDGLHLLACGDEGEITISGT